MAFLPLEVFLSNLSNWNIHDWVSEPSIFAWFLLPILDQELLERSLYINFCNTEVKEEDLNACLLDSLSQNHVVNTH